MLANHLSMNKIKILLFLVIAITNVVYADFTLGSSISLDEVIADHKDSFVGLDPLINDISYSTSTWHLSDRTETTHWWFSLSGKAMKALKRYRRAHGNLLFESCSNACGNGFLIGAAAALFQKIAQSKKVDENMYYGIISMVLSVVLFQNYRIGIVPYFENDLKKHDDLFSTISNNTLIRFFCMLASAGLSYMGTGYAIDKVNEIYCKKLIKCNQTLHNEEVTLSDLS